MTDKINFQGKIGFSQGDLSVTFDKTNVSIIAEKISNNCRNRRLKENNRKAVIDNQIKIYEALLESTNADMNQ